MLKIKELSASDKIRFVAAAVFILVELTLGILIQEYVGEWTNGMCFSSVILAFFFCSLVGDFSFDGIITSLGLLFTVFSDYCLVIMNPQPRVTAMIFFNTVQLLYFLRLFYFEKQKRKRIIHVSVRVAAIIIGVIGAVLVLGDGVDLLSIISIIYFANLAVNLIYSFLYGKRFLIFAIGLVFFALCDVFVGLSVLVSDYLSVSTDSLLYKLTHTGVNLVWLFYVPSQTLIALSNIKFIKTKNN